MNDKKDDQLDTAEEVDGSEFVWRRDEWLAGICYFNDGDFYPGPFFSNLYYGQRNEG